MMEHIADGMPQIGPHYMQPTEFFDFDVEAVRQFAYAAVGDAATAKDKAVRLFYAVRDSIRYDPYSISMDRETYKASHVLGMKAGFCLPKANLLAACARATGVPAGIGLSDVVNHLCTDRLRRMMGGKELFLHHGYTVLYVDGKWLKAAPAFNIELCDRFGVMPTEFDGESHALLQQYDAAGRHHMDYVMDHGIWSDFPLERVTGDFRAYYPPSLFDAEARAAVDRTLKTEKRGFENERPLA